MGKLIAQAHHHHSFYLIKDGIAIKLLKGCFKIRHKKIGKPLEIVSECEKFI